jgi:hypothetical protein
MLGDYYKANPEIAAKVDLALKIIKWFNNHSYPLGLLNTKQIITNNIVLALILPVIS